MKNTREKDVKICPHCGLDLAIRNPSGFCDHLYYPEYCKVCAKIANERLKQKHLGI